MNQALPFQDLIATLQAYWRKQGCLDWLPYHEAVGAGTLNPATVLRVLGPEPWNVAYVEPSFRPDDGRFGDNPNRVQMHHQFQVILQPAPRDPLGLYLGSLKAIGLNIAEHDVRFVEDNWESPALGAWGLGWEVWLDGMEITQFTYFQQAGGMSLESPAVEITYGLERVAMYLQNVNSIWDISWDGKLSYGEILKQQEIEFCQYDFNKADMSLLKNLYQGYVAEAKLCLEQGLVIPAHDYVLKCSHTFNILDARGAIGLAERVKYFAEMRGLARKVSAGFYEQRKELGFPLMKYLPAWSEPAKAELPNVSDSAQDFVLELGVEELAASTPDSLSKQLEQAITEMLKEHDLSHGAVRSFSTPRRLTVSIEKIKPRQDDKTLVVKGPKKDVCLKNPKALEGFCKKNGIEPSEVKYEVSDGVECASATVHVKGLGTAQLLAEKLPAIIGSLKTADNMRWLSVAQVGEQVAATTFNRPVRWIVSLYGKDVVPFYFASVASGRASCSGRWADSAEFEIKSASSYLSDISSQNITLDVSERAKLITEQANAIAAKAGLTAQIRESVLNEVTQLVERPTAFLGSIDAKFTELPNIVLAGVMEKHLRCFPALDKNNQITGFIGVRNGTEESIDVVRRGFERVIAARFSDAAFFVSRDGTKNIDEFRERIKTLTFVEGLGSMYDKTERLKKLSHVVAKMLPQLKTVPSEVERAALLSKADLGSQMVIEMSSLQGKMGEIYAKKFGEPEAVSKALAEQYLPAFAGDKIPQTPLGTVLSLSDKIDTVAALFSIGAQPTGSADPYGIRREVMGIIAIALGQKLDISLKELFLDALTNLGAADKSKALADITEFVKRRLEVVLREQGRRYDVVRAVLSKFDDNPAKAEKIIVQLEAALADKSNDDAFTAYLRCFKIFDHARSKGIEVGNSVSSEKLSDAAEKTLWEGLSKINGSVDTLDAALQSVKKLVTPINSFFDTVMVMAEDKAVRENRLAMVRKVVDLFDRYADLSAIEFAGS